MNSAFAMGDKLCQIEAMDGAAKCLEILRIQQKICNCRPLEFNNKLLQTAIKVGAKVNKTINNNYYNIFLLFSSFL